MAQQKQGQLPSEDIMTDRLFVRVDKETKMQLARCAAAYNMTRSDIVRKGIRMVQDSLKK